MLLVKLGGRSETSQLQNLFNSLVVIKQCKRSISGDVPSSKIAVIGVPFAKGQVNDEGVELGPTALREGGIIKELKQLGHNVRDYGNIQYTKAPVEESSMDMNMKDLLEVAACNLEVSRQVEEVLRSDSLALVLGGDHSLVVGSVDGHIHSKGPDIGLIYVDAHADLNTADTSPSGNVHGMTVALLVKELSDYWPYLPGMDWQKPVLSLKNLAYIGLRSVDQYERLLLNKFHIQAYGMKEVEKYGIDKVTEMVLDNIDPNATKSLHVSFDIDALDTLEAPSTGCPERGGLTLREAVHFMELIHDTGRMNVMDLVEVNPQIGTPKDIRKTVEAGVHVTKAAFGFSRLGNVPRHVFDIPGRYNSSIESEKTE